MVTLVHVAPAKLAPCIRRAGLRAGAQVFGGAQSAGVFAFPVLQSHTLTHQWTREIMKWRRQPVVGVYFRLPDRECVRYGHYLYAQTEASAANAVAAIRALPDARGFQVLVQRSVRPQEITRIVPIAGVIGWRHMPDAHGRRPCACPACLMRGEPGGAKLRARDEGKF